MYSLLSYIKDGDYLTAIIVALSRCFVIFCCMPVHEYAHGYAAYKLGDTTAKEDGRLTLDPFKHLDILGTIMIFLFGIGYARPVMIDFSRLKHPRRDTALVALAGPFANLLSAFVSIFVACGVARFAGSGTVASAVVWFFYYAAAVNVSLAVFNLFPIPPLDGSKVLAAVLPDKAYYKYMRYERYIMIALMILLFMGALNTPISIVSNFFMSIISYIPSLIFGVSIS